MATYDTIDEANEAIAQKIIDAQPTLVEWCPRRPSFPSWTASSSCTPARRSRSRTCRILCRGRRSVPPYSKAGRTDEAVRAAGLCRGGRVRTEQRLPRRRRDGRNPHRQPARVRGGERDRREPRATRRCTRARARSCASASTTSRSASTWNGCATSSAGALEGPQAAPRRRAGGEPHPGAGGRDGRRIPRAQHGRLEPVFRELGPKLVQVGLPQKELESVLDFLAGNINFFLTLGNGKREGDAGRGRDDPGREHRHLPDPQRTGVRHPRQRPREPMVHRAARKARHAVFPGFTDGRRVPGLRRQRDPGGLRLRRPGGGRGARRAADGRHRRRRVRRRPRDQRGAVGDHGRKQPQHADPELELQGRARRDRHPQGRRHRHRAAHHDAVMHKKAGIGMVGVGKVRASMPCFTAALEALGEARGVRPPAEAGEGVRCRSCASARRSCGSSAGTWPAEGALGLRDVAEPHGGPAVGQLLDGRHLESTRHRGDARGPPPLRRATHEDGLRRRALRPCGAEPRGRGRDGRITRHDGLRPLPPARPEGRGPPTRRGRWWSTWR